MVEAPPVRHKMFWPKRGAVLLSTPTISKVTTRLFCFFCAIDFSTILPYSTAAVPGNFVMLWLSGSTDQFSIFSNV